MSLGQGSARRSPDTAGLLGLLGLQKQLVRRQFLGDKFESNEQVQQQNNKLSQKNQPTKIFKNENMHVYIPEALMEV